MSLVNVKFVKSDVAEAVEANAHRIVVIDCSGSMGGVLPAIRKALKNKIPTMVKPGDLLSIVWFSGKNEFGTLIEAAPISTLKDLSNVNNSIDRFLNTVGLTAFVQPLEEVLRLANSQSMPATMFFMTDGWDNQYAKTKILNASAALADVISNTTFVEFGWYADHDLLTKMAEEAGGSLIQSSDFDSYVQQLESDLSGVSVGKKIEVEVPANVEYVVAQTSNGFIVSKAADGKSYVPAGTSKYAWIDESGTGLDDVNAALLCAAALVQRGKTDLALDILNQVGDVDVYQSLVNAFSKQDYANAVELMVQYASGQKTLYTSAPKNTNLAPNPDAYNVLQMLMDIAEDDGNLLHVSHPSFNYSSIGHKRETADVNGFVPKFIPGEADIKASISALKFDEDRPNVSILVRNEGSVYLPKNEFFADEKFHTFIWRNYAIIKDGIINLKTIPLVLTAKTHAKLTQEGIINEPFKIGKTYLVNTTNMPVINRTMVQDVSANTLANLAVEAYRLRCIQKVINARIKEEGVKPNAFKDKYGEDAANFLKEYGITDGGFSPKTVKGDTVDPYMSKLLAVKLKGMSAIPSIADVEKAIGSGKALTASQAALKSAMDTCDSVTDLNAYKAQIKAQLQSIVASMVKIKFSVILGKKWFKEFASMDDNTIVVKDKSGKDVTVTFALEEKEV